MPNDCFCLEERPGEPCSACPACKKRMHSVCLKEWKAHRPCCPFCRAAIPWDSLDETANVIVELAISPRVYGWGPDANLALASLLLYVVTCEPLALPRLAEATRS